MESSVAQPVSKTKREIVGELAAGTVIAAAGSAALLAVLLHGADKHPESISDYDQEWYASIVD
jgi:hypothetical protein